MRISYWISYVRSSELDHDLAICVGFYAVFQIEVTPATVIAFLTILGYSLYDTIVVFDRMQENEAKLKGTGRVTYSAVASKSLNPVLMRSLNSTIASLLPFVADRKRVV